jgi:hypothetical protein
MTNSPSSYYGFTSSEEVKLDAQGLPEGTYKALIKDEQPDVKDGTLRGFTVEWEILDGQFKGKTAKTWYLTMHTEPQTANIARQNIKRIAEATGSAVSASAPLKGRILTLQVGVQKKNPDYTEIKKYLPADYVAAPF